MKTKQIVFIGGIHGVGKGTLCREIEKVIQVETISASDLLKWNEVSKEFGNKAVTNINDKALQQLMS